SVASAAAAGAAVSAGRAFARVVDVGAEGGLVVLAREVHRRAAQVPPLVGGDGRAAGDRARDDGGTQEESGGAAHDGPEPTGAGGALSSRDLTVPGAPSIPARNAAELRMDQGA